jgi:hypothetical protein
MTKEQIIQELEKLPEPVLQKVLEFAKTLQVSDSKLEDQIWQAYLASEQERREVYQRLANS